MIINFKNNSVYLKNVSDFSLSDIFDCGQCFRWEKISDNEYEGVAFSHALRIKQTENEIIFFDVSENEFNEIWFNYFDFSTNYGNIKNSLSSDSVMKTVINDGTGIRILKQDLFETVISFIISQSNNIPRIKKIINSLCTLYGNKICRYGKEYYSFPTPSVLAEADLSPIKAGFRDKYIKSAAIAFCDSSLNDRILALNHEDAKKELMNFKGIGNKVSDCVLLFGLYKTDAFPVDVWMKRIMEKLYFYKESEISEIEFFATNKYGKFSGFAQQYLYYYAIKHKSDFTD